MNNFLLPSVFVLTNTGNLADDAVELIKGKFKFSKPVKFIAMDLEKLKDPWFLINELKLIEEQQEKASDKPEEEIKK